MMSNKTYPYGIDLRDTLHTSFSLHLLKKKLHVDVQKPSSTRVISPAPYGGSAVVDWLA